MNDNRTKGIIASSNSSYAFLNRDVQVLIYFLLSFLLGSVLMFKVPIFWWIPAIVVFVFFVLLFFLQNILKWFLSEVARDSVYFLGFLFTEMALIFIFLRFVDSKGQFANHIEDIPSAVAIALSTTIVGLVARHVLVMASPKVDENEDNHNFFLRDIVKYQHNALEAYNKVQNDFVTFAGNQRAEHENLLRQESRLVADYEKELKNAKEALIKVRISAVEVVEEGIKRLDEVVKNHQDNMLRITKTVKDPLEVTTSEFQTNISEVNNVLRHFITNVRGSLQAGDLSNLTNQVLSVQKALLMLEQSLSRTVEYTNASSKVSQDVANDLKSVDYLLTNFIDIANNQLTNLANHYNRQRDV